MSVTLAIDTSCDETSVAVVENTVVLSNVVASQVELHKPYGGVFPTVAKQAHKENIDRCVTLAIKRSGKSWNEIDSISVTQGPGLAPALEVGIRKAKALAEEHSLPLLPINHIEGHVLSVLAQAGSTDAKKMTERISQKVELERPVLALVISGGHSDFIKISKIGEYQRLGWTIDDAAGEALDKVGRMLDLGYPAGPVIEEFAARGNPSTFDFPLPMTSSGDYNLSFSGLKTFARRLIEELDDESKLSKQVIYDFCASLQYAVFRHICHKLSKVLLDNHDLGQVWLGGGVAANTTLREMIRQTIRQHLKDTKQKGLNLPLSTKLKTPYSKKLCGDNAAMIGVVANVSNVEAIKDFERKPKLKI
jgi:N6-L-threonylcarbamoyladenine synthase